VGKDRKVRLSGSKSISPEVKGKCLIHDTRKIIPVSDNVEVHSTALGESAGDDLSALVDLFLQLNDVPHHLRITLDVGFVIVRLQLLNRQPHKLDRAVIEQNDEAAFALRGHRAVLVCFDSVLNISSLGPSSVLCLGMVTASFLSSRGDASHHDNTGHLPLDKCLDI